MARTIRDNQLVLRVSDPLRRELQRAADEGGLYLSEVARAVLVSWAAGRVAEQGQQQQAAV